MSLLNKSRINSIMNTENLCDRLIVTPLFDIDQVGSCTIDLRLGSVFLVDKRTRTSALDPMDKKRPVSTFFDKTYRDVGEKFILYPNQLVIACTIEYIKLPLNVLGEINSRSSMNRLGLSMSSVVQPGYAGVISLELFNNSTNPIVLYPGVRIVQMKLYEVDSSEGVESYATQQTSKYRVISTPRLSGLAKDKDFDVIEKFSK